MARGQNWRTLFAHHASLIFRCYRLHHRGVNYDDSATICSYDDDGSRGVHRVRGGFGMDIEYSTAASGEGMIYVVANVEFMP